MGVSVSFLISMVQYARLQKGCDIPLKENSSRVYCITDNKTDTRRFKELTGAEGLVEVLVPPDMATMMFLELQRRNESKHTYLKTKKNCYYREHFITI